MTCRNCLAHFGLLNNPSDEERAIFASTVKNNAPVPNGVVQSMRKAEEMRDEGS